MEIKHYSDLSEAEQQRIGRALQKHKYCKYIQERHPLVAPCGNRYYDQPEYARNRKTKRTFTTTMLILGFIFLAWQIFYWLNGGF